jgi:hypothetical protein
LAQRPARSPSPERPSGCRKPVVSRETTWPSFRHRLQISCTALGVLLLATACGYQPVRSGQGERLAVRAATHALPELDAVQAALAGARSELGHLSALREDAGYPALMVEVFHVQERSSGIRKAPAIDDTPLAQSSELTLSGRAWILDRAGGKARADTGPVAITTSFASGPDESTDRQRRDGALRRAARQLGRTLARRALGVPEAGSPLD